MGRDGIKIIRQYLFLDNLLNAIKYIDIIIIQDRI